MGPQLSPSLRSLLAPLLALAILFSQFFPIVAFAEVPSATEALPSWNDGPAKQAIVDFVKAKTDKSSPDFVPPEARIATSNQNFPSCSYRISSLGMSGLKRTWSISCSIRARSAWRGCFYCWQILARREGQSP